MVGLCSSELVFPVTLLSYTTVYCVWESGLCWAAACSRRTERSRMVWEGVETWCFLQTVHKVCDSGFLCIYIKESLILYFFQNGVGTVIHYTRN